MNVKLIFFTVVAALGGLLFGFDTAVISGTIPFITQYFALNSVELGWTVSIALIGCIVGSISAGKPADLFGRKKMLIATAVLFAVSAFWSGLTSSFIEFLLARFIGGIAIGAVSVLSPMYISEIAPARLRGRLVSTAQLAIVTGIVVAFFSNYLLSGTGDNNWRYMFIAGGVPAVFFFFLLFFVSESPRWLVKMSRTEAAEKIIKSLNPDSEVNKILSEVRQSLTADKKTPDVSLFRKPYLRLALIGIAVGLFNQLTGINAIMYYAPTIFTAAGFSTDAALMQTVLVGLTNLTFTFIGMSLIDKLGRKFLLLAGACGMAFFLGVFAIAFLMKAFAGYILLVCMLGFIASFATTQGVVIWVILSEMFPNIVRAKGASLGTFSHWVFNAVNAFVFPIAVENFGVGPVFAFYAAGTIISWFFFKKYLVETKGKSLEELEAIVLQKS